MSINLQTPIKMRIHRDAYSDSPSAANLPKPSGHTTSPPSSKLPITRTPLGSVKNSTDARHRHREPTNPSNSKFPFSYDRAACAQSIKADSPPSPPPTEPLPPSPPPGCQHGRTMVVQFGQLPQPILQEMAVVPVPLVQHVMAILPTPVPIYAPSAPDSRLNASIDATGNATEFSPGSESVPSGLKRQVISIKPSGYSRRASSFKPARLQYQSLNEICGAGHGNKYPPRTSSLSPQTSDSTPLPIPMNESTPDPNFGPSTAKGALKNKKNTGKGLARKLWEKIRKMTQ